MSTYFYGHQQHMQNSHVMMQSNHHGRSRRNQRMSSAQPNNRQYKQQQHHTHQQQQSQLQKLPEKPISSEPTALTAFKARFEAGRSFDLDDDLEFCPNLLTWDERRSVTSGSSDRSSLSSGSPESSPLQHQIQPHMAPTSSLSSSSYPSPPTNFDMNAMKLHQPSAIRSRNPIPIVNPDTRTRMSPPSSMSPSMMQQTTGQRTRW